MPSFGSSQLMEIVERRSHRILGKCEIEGEPQTFRLGLKRARQFGAQRIALIGEAAHVLPPIGAQGLNLGLRDTATIVELVLDARRRGRDIGERALLDAYDAARRFDVRFRMLAC